MKNKVNLKKAIILSIIIFFIFGLVFVLLNYIGYSKYTKNSNRKMAQIIINIEKNYPEANRNEIIEKLNSKTDENTKIFKNYGIDIKKDALVFENDEEFKIFLILNIVTLFLLFLSLTLVFLLYNYTKDKKLKEITKYIEEINRRNYKLDIEDNTEDELSILKSEVYKTTVMLKEVAENSKQDKLKLKDSISDISHQLKTPLTSITIMLDNMLDNTNMEEKTRIDFIKDIKREITNLSFLVSSLLKLSKFDSNTINFINNENYAQDIINEAATNVAGICDLKNVKINICGETKAKINCDFKWQVEAITNILKNCVEHSYENSKLDITLSKNKIYTKIEIRDYGVGIDKNDLPHIFERFYKGKNSSSDSIGIGLALAKSIIEENEGYIDVESNKDKGTLFTIKYFN